MTGYRLLNQPSYKETFKTGAEYGEAAPEIQTTGSSKAAGTAGLAGAAATANPYVIAGAAAFQVVAGLHEAEMIRMNAEITRKINDMNARSLEEDAYQVEKYGESEIAAYQPTIMQTVADQRSALAAQGVDVNSASAMSIQNETRLTGFLNTIQMQREARAKALGIKRQARNVRMGSEAQSSASAMQAQGAVTSGIVGGVGTAVSGYTRR